MDAEQKRKQLEQDILDILEEKLHKGEMDSVRARAIAQMVLESLRPPLTIEQFYDIVPTLDDHFVELSQAVLPIIQEHDDKIRKVVLGHAEKLIKEGKIGESLAILKLGTNNSK